MKIIFLLIVLLFISSCLCNTNFLKEKKTGDWCKRRLNEDCDVWNCCEGDIVCKDFRCSPRDTPDNQLEWGAIKCDWAHKCNDNKRCIEHRCVV
jgi:hypothetical protein